MDLQGLKIFIEDQKMRLSTERAALYSKARNRNVSAHLEDDTASEYAPREVKSHSEVKDSFAERINHLYDFKNQVSELSSSQNVFNPLKSENSAYNEDGQISLSFKQNCSQLPPLKNPSRKIEDNWMLDANIVPKELDIGSQVNNLSEAQHSPVDLCRRRKPRSISQSQNREEEVERLQSKFSSLSFWDSFGKSVTTKKENTNPLETMVRVGEFSPANPDLQAPGRALLGLGEYEERRRQLLEKKKQEYKEYLSLSRNNLQKTDHLQHPSMKIHLENLNNKSDFRERDIIFNHVVKSVDVATQTDMTLAQLSATEFGPKLAVQVQCGPSTLHVGEPCSQPLSPREKLNLELRHHCAPCFVPRAHSSQTTEQLPDARLRQLQLQEELRRQIEEKRRLEAERREQERLEEEALQKRVAEQQAKLKAEYEREEKLRREREIQKQQQIEDFQRRQEELRVESEALKKEERRQKLEAAEIYLKQEVEQHSPQCSRGPKNAHLAPPSEPAAVSILKCNSPPLRSPRMGIGSPTNDEPVSPRAIIKVLEGPTVGKQNIRLEDSLPIPLMPTALNLDSAQPALRPSCRSPHSPPLRSPRRSPASSPRLSPSRFIPEQDWPKFPAQSDPLQQRSEAMRNLEERWKVPAVQKNVCVRAKRDVQGSTGNVLTQLGAFRRQLQMEHMRMEEKVKKKHQPAEYNQKYFQQHVSQRRQLNS